MARNANRASYNDSFGCQSSFFSSDYNRPSSTNNLPEYERESKNRAAYPGYPFHISPYIVIREETTDSVTSESRDERRADLHPGK